LAVRREYFYRFTPVKLKERRRENGMGDGEVRYICYRECGRKVQGQCLLVLLVKVVWISGTRAFK
jgi:hypothetical protein